VGFWLREADDPWECAGRSVGPTDGPWGLIGRSILAGVFMVVLLAFTDGPSLAHGRSAVGDGRSVRPIRTVRPWPADLVKSFSS
jgi:hypothetical protein